MLQFLSSVFAVKYERGAGPDKALIERAIERVVDGTDPRLRGMGNYRKRLRASVEKAVAHVTDLVDAFPEATEISRRAYATDPRLRAFFASADRLQEVIGGSRAIKDYVRDAQGPLPDAIFGVVAMEWKEKNVLGVELSGEVLRRDVPQVVVSFFNHRYLGPAGSDEETRRQVKIRIFDYLIEQVLKRIASARSERVELEQQQRLLKRKLDAMKAGNWGLQSMLAETEKSHADYEALESDVEAVEARLLELGASVANLEAVFEVVDEILGRPAEWISRRDLELNLDAMLIKTEVSSTRPASQLQLTEVFSCTGERRILLPGWFRRSELPEQPDFSKQAQRYLR